MMDNCQAGNLLPDKRFKIYDTGHSVGAKGTYVVTENLNVLFDADYPSDLANNVVDQINSTLVDIKLDMSYSTTDYTSSTTIDLDEYYRKNGSFVHLGSDFGSDFFASLRVFEPTGEPGCFIHLREADYVLAEDKKKEEILAHEIHHCLLWDHASNNPYVGSFDFDKQDAKEVLYRLYDKQNTKGMITINIVKDPATVVGFIESGFGANLTGRKKSVYTKDNQVKLIPGKYKIQVGDKYICKKKKKKKLCGKVRNARKFQWTDDRLIEVE